MIHHFIRCCFHFDIMHMALLLFTYYFYLTTGPALGQLYREGYCIFTLPCNWFRSKSRLLGFGAELSHWLLTHRTIQVLGKSAF